MSRGVGGTRTIVRLGEYTHKCAPIRESKTMRRRGYPPSETRGKFFFCFFKLRNRGFTISARLYTCTHSAHTVYTVLYCCTRKYKRTNRSVFYTDRTATRSSSWVWIIIKLKCEFIIIYNIMYNTRVVL